MIAHARDAAPTTLHPRLRLLAPVILAAALGAGLALTGAVLVSVAVVLSAASGGMLLIHLGGHHGYVSGHKSHGDSPAPAVIGGELEYPLLAPHSRGAIDRRGDSGSPREPHWSTRSGATCTRRTTTWSMFTWANPVQKLGEAASQPRCVETVKGIRYRMREAAP